MLQDHTFPSYRFVGSPRELGRQHGETRADAIHEHRDIVLARLRQNAGVDRARVLELALRFQPVVAHHTPLFDEEICGIAEGAGLTVAEVYALQLRAELAVLAKEESAVLQQETADECTTFALQPGTTANGVGLAGQNADLPGFYRDLCAVVEFVPEDGPRVLMLTPAGQVSYIGINDRGLAVFANYLVCGGWRLGFPRYLLSRLALTQSSVDAAVATVRGVSRASSRNLIMLDGGGSAIDLETTPTRDGPLEPVAGLLAHTNHYLSAELLGEEASAPRYVKNSRIRYARITELLASQRGQLNADRMETICRDRATLPDAISRAEADDPGSDTITIASIIAEPALGRMRVAVGPPHEHQYRQYAFTDA